MQVLYMLERIRTPWLDALMQAMTQFGSETVFLAVALVLFWCVDKRKAYYLMSVSFIGTVSSQIMKMAFRIPRPWVRDPAFTIVEAAREGAGGYSFPSGHSQSAVGTFGMLALTAKKKYIRAAAIAIALIVPITRMYLGVHTPADVLAGSAVALVLLAVLRPFCLEGGSKQINWLFGAMTVLAFVFTAYAELFPFPADIDMRNLESARKNAYTLLGTMAGMIVVYYVDEKILHFPVEANWFAQVCKILGGLVLVLLVKEGLRFPLEALLGGHLISRSVRYMLTVLMAGAVWPLTFPWFSKFGRKDPP